MDTVNEDSGYVAYVNVVSLEMRFKQHDGSIIHGPIDEIVHQQIYSHSRGHTEHRGEPKTDAIAAVENGLFGFHFRAPIQGDRPQRCILCAKFSFFPDAVAAVCHRHHDALFAAGQLQHRQNRVTIDGLRAYLITVTYRSAYQSCQRNDDIRVLQ